MSLLVRRPGSARGATSFSRCRARSRRAPGAAPVLSGKATVKRLAFGVGGGDWADTALIPDAIAISTKVVFKPKP